jgi:hypothetical protein
MLKNGLGFEDNSQFRIIVMIMNLKNESSPFNQDEHGSQF